MRYEKLLANYRRRRERILSLSRKGKSLSDIARQEGITRQRVHQLVVKAANDKS